MPWHEIDCCECDTNNWVHCPDADPSCPGGLDYDGFTCWKCDRDQGWPEYEDEINENSYLTEGCADPTATGDRPMRVQEQILDDIAAERVRQDAMWGGEKHDDAESQERWASFIMVYLGKYAHWDASEVTQRTNLVKLAALAVAAIESLDRKKE